MRPLIEILEEERRLLQRLNLISSRLFKDDEPEVQEILLAQRKKFQRDLKLVHDELVERLAEL